MKRSFITLAILVSCILAQALTVDKLINKYKKLPNVVYREIKGKELKNQIDSVSSENEKEILRSANKMVIMMFLEEEPEELEVDLKALKDYSLALSYNMEDDDEPADAIPSLNIMPSIAVDVYGKDGDSSEYILKPVLFMKLFEMSVFIYLDGKIRPDDTKELIKVS